MAKQKVTTTKTTTTNAGDPVCNAVCNLCI